MSARLPLHPDLDQLKRQAKELLRAIRDGDATAIAQLRQHHPEQIEPASAKLADAQLVLARSYQAPSWSRLVQACRLVDAIWRDDLDAVTITTSTVVHREVIGQAIAAGKHVFTEKLLAPTVGEAEEILVAARAAGVQVVVSLPRLYHGYTTAITEVLDGGSLGRLTYARVRLSHDGATAGWLPERFFDPETAMPISSGVSGVSHNRAESTR